MRETSPSRGSRPMRESRRSSPQPGEGGAPALRLEAHRQVGYDDELLGEGRVVDQRDVRQVDAGLGGRPAVAVQRDVADRLAGLIGQGVLLAGDRVELGMPGEAGLQRAAEVGARNALQLIVQLDRQGAGLDHGAELAADADEVGVHAAVAQARPRAADGRAAHGGRGGGVLHEAAAIPFRLAVAQPQAVGHAGAGEPVVVRHVRRRGRVGPDPQQAASELRRDAADHLQVEGGRLDLHGTEVAGEIGRARAGRPGGI